MEAISPQSLLSFSSQLCKPRMRVAGIPQPQNIKVKRSFEIICHAMLAPRKHMQRKTVEVYKDAADAANQRNWRKLMAEIEELGSAVPVLKTRRAKEDALPRDLVLGTLVRFKQLKKWDIVSEILEWLRTQHWWDISVMDLLMLITAYGKLGDFNRAERVLRYMNKKGYSPSVISHTALMEAYGRSHQYRKAEAIFRRMQLSGPDPSPITYQIILKTFVEGDMFKEAEAVFESLLKEERSSFKPDQKMFHMMIYMYKKAGNSGQARRIFALMDERGIPKSAVTYNSLMSFETDYKEVSRIYDQMQRAGVKPDVVSYALLVSAYGKARREEEALSVFEEMLDAGVRPTRKAYNILLDAFAISGMVDQARTVFKSMRRENPDLCSYATMLSAYVNASDMDGAEKFFRRIKEDGLKPNVVVYGTLMKGYARLNNLEKVLRVYERMKLQGVEANQTIYTTIMDAHGKNSDFGSAVVWFKEMSAHGLPPDQKAKNILLSLAKTAEEKIEANELVGDANVSSNDSPNEQLKFLRSDEHGNQINDSEIKHPERFEAAFDPSEVNRNELTDIGDDSDDYDEEGVAGRVHEEVGEIDFVSLKREKSRYSEEAC
ncbi:pentatricopeptide repeat-containing protein At3g59040-like isoform X2 [Zingiber officinale]|uniref:pentatricopeptide repeat-containing protein At3g59040-like isoform X2 n=1 Tax=Zingiber officinale TaxID=94328 RepID=UPI001C4B610B|nr:pentatricopeptide repeat-containing protein At3g59040-like isoform X2 [Zingiber officinale]